MAENKKIQVGTAVAEPGKITRGELLLGHFPDAPITSPVMIACGKEPGPVLWIQGCVHGPEIGGPVAMQRVLGGLDASTLKGTIVCVMLANPNAFRGYSRNTPLDGENLNRIFPGSPSGAHSQQTAHYLFEAAESVADAFLDLHSGGDRSIVPFYALYRNDGSDASKRARELAEAAGTPDIWASTDSWLTGAMFTNLTARGIPSLIIECGGGGQLSDSDVEKFETAITGIGRALGIIPGDAPRQQKYRVMDNALLVYSQKGGFFLPAVETGAVVREGQELGRIFNPYGDVIETVTSPMGPAWIGSMRKRYMPVYSGDQIAEVIGVLED